jgi:hypothetical protein
VSPAWSDRPAEHHDDDGIPDSGVSSGPYEAAYQAWRHRATRW